MMGEEAPTQILASSSQNPWMAECRSNFRPNGPLAGSAGMLEMEVSGLLTFLFQSIHPDTHCEKSLYDIRYDL